MEHFSEFTEKQKTKFIIEWALKAGLSVIMAFVLCFTALSMRGLGWFAKNDQVEANGITVSVTDEGDDSTNFETAYAGKFRLSDKINFGIDDSLLLYPQNYITVIFTVSKETDFKVVTKQKPLTPEEFYERFSQRRDLLLGDFTTDKESLNYYDVENVFAYADYVGGGYASFIDGLPARPAISMAYNASAAFDAARSSYLSRSIPYLVDFLYRFSLENSMYDALTFSLYVQDGATVSEYILLPDTATGSAGETDEHVFIPMFYRQVVDGQDKNEGWQYTSDPLILQPNLESETLTYALVVGYGTDFYSCGEEDGQPALQITAPLHPGIFNDAANSALHFSHPDGGMDTTPYLGAYYSSDYNCFIGRSIAVRLGQKTVAVQPEPETNND